MVSRCRGEDDVEEQDGESMSDSIGSQTQEFQNLKKQISNTYRDLNETSQRSGQSLHVFKTSKFSRTENIGSVRPITVLTILFLGGLALHSKNYKKGMGLLVLANGGPPASQNQVKKTLSCQRLVEAAFRGSAFRGLAFLGSAFRRLPFQRSAFRGLKFRGLKFSGFYFSQIGVPWIDVLEVGVP